MKLKTTHDARAQRYEVDLGDGHTAWVAYSHLAQGVIALDYSEVPVALRGKGAGAALMENVLTVIDAENLRVVPVCGYIRHYIDRHKQWSHLLHGDN